MQRVLKKTFTPAEYLAMETVAEYKSEYFNGKIYALSGGTAFNFYKAIPTLRDYLLVDSEGPRVECYRKVDDDQWSLEVVEDLDGQVSLGSIGCTIGIREIYTKVSWLT